MHFEFGRTQAITVGALVLVAILLAALYNMGGGTPTGQAELLVNCESIRQAQLKNMADFETYLSAEASPRNPLRVDATGVAWKPSRGFEKLAWSPTTETVLGSYSVHASAAGFKVTGAVDADGDGVQARCVATQDDAASLTTAPDIY